MDVRNEDRAVIQEHWKGAVVFTDALHVEFPGEMGNEVPENELLLGELSAATFSVGCYTIRSAQRVYRIYGPVYSPEMETPANQEETELVRKNIIPMGMAYTGLLDSAWRDKLRVTHEISARHNDAPEGKFTYICRAAEARNARWKEHISAIYSVKESKFIPNEYASLLVCLVFAGDSYGVDTWYKLDPTGKITTLRLHPFDSKQDQARFT